MKKIRSWAKKIKHYITTLYLVLKRQDVHWLKKAYIGLIVFYAISPVDLIPDFIPILGYLDDVIILPILIIFALKMIPKHILDECKKEAEEKYGDIKLTSRTAGIIIILIWLLIIAYLIYRFFLF